LELAVKKRRSDYCLALGQATAALMKAVLLRLLQTVPLPFGLPFRAVTTRGSLMLNRRSSSVRSLQACRSSRDERLVEYHQTSSVTVEAIHPTEKVQSISELTDEDLTRWKYAMDNYRIEESLFEKVAKEVDTMKKWMEKSVEEHFKQSSFAPEETIREWYQNFTAATAKEEI
jgi:hypothetical protein